MSQIKNPWTVYPGDLHPQDILPKKIVAVIGHSGDWAAYEGPTDWPDEEIARHGDKLGANQAKAMFPSLAYSGLIYRP